MYEKPDLLAEIICFFEKVARGAFDIHNMPLHVGIAHLADLNSVVVIEHDQLTGKYFERKCISVVWGKRNNATVFGELVRQFTYTETGRIFIVDTIVMRVPVSAGQMPFTNELVL